MTSSTKTLCRYFSFLATLFLFSQQVVSAHPMLVHALTMAVEQSSEGEEPAANPRAEVDQLLAEARTAIAQGKLQEAEKLVSKAESYGLNYPVLHFGDTPAKVRQELGKHQPHQQKTTQEKGAVNNPFAEGQSPQTAPHPAIPSQASKESPREQCDAELLAARRSLAVGDVAKAEQHVANAKQFSIAYSEKEDSPSQLERSIDEYKQLSANQGKGPLWKQGYSQFLISQATALLQWGDLENAERAASEAASLNASLGTPNPSLDNLLSKIQQRRQGNPVAPAPTSSSATSLSSAKAKTQQLLQQARGELSAGNIQQAARLAAEASQLDVAETQFGPDEDSPAKLAADLQRAQIEGQNVRLSNAAMPLTLTFPDQESPPLDQETPSAEVAQRMENGNLTRLPAPEETPSMPTNAPELLREGEEALRGGDRSTALLFFKQAYTQREELDLESQEKLQDHLQMLSAAPAAARASQDASLLNSAGAGQTVLARQISAEIGKRQSEANQLRESDPRAALKLLREGLALVSESGLDESTKTQLSRRLDLSIRQTEQHISDNSAEIELDEANQRVHDDIERERAVKVEVQNRIADLVNQFNKLRDEHRYAEMEVVAKRLHEMAPNEPIAQQVWESARFIRRSILNQEIEQLTEEGVVQELLATRRRAGQGLVDAQSPITYSDDWEDLIKGRTGSNERNSRRSARELEIERKLRTPVLPNYTNMPLSEVVQSLSDLTDVNIHLDARGLGQEGVRSDTPVTLNLSQEISLESALSLILDPLHLTYMIKNEVLKVTSEQLRDGEVYPEVYDVADLVVPIPNFVPTNNMGLQGLINDAYAALPQRNHSQSGPVALVPSNMPDQANKTPMSENVLAQQFGGNPVTGNTMPTGPGPGGMGGAANADFDSLIDLIVSTVEHDSWMENGTGEGEIQPFPTNLSLVISQTQRVHEQIADLLEQLRRLQDLQVTIEVRFIRLTDSFFERVGIDFDFNIEDGTAIQDLDDPDATFEPARASATVGISGNPTTLGTPIPTFTADLDVPFRQNSFTLSQPQFGNAQDIGQFGFAILSDIEAFFLINASQGDSRSNVLQAPKVTLFNGQQAVIVDSAFRPFVISVIPVVGEFAAAQQPVIVVLSEGTLMTVQAVVSDDRRYVRLTLVPFFSSIGEVDTFTFEGSTTTSSSSSNTDEDDDGNNEANDEAEETVISGTTVQLPTFQVISVSTTVSVPDGGTVLLGGIKRLREGRNEYGVPMLSKIPYVDRLFRNVGIGRETDSLMLMVTPHIIIQEEEEERLGISPE